MICNQHALYLFLHWLPAKFRQGPHCSVPCTTQTSMGQVVWVVLICARYTCTLKKLERMSPVEVRDQGQYFSEHTEHVLCMKSLNAI